MSEQRRFRMVQIAFHDFLRVSLPQVCYGALLYTSGKFFKQPLIGFHSDAYSATLQARVSWMTLCLEILIVRWRLMSSSSL